VLLFDLTQGIGGVDHREKDLCHQQQMRRCVREAVQRYAGVVDEVFPADYLADHQLLPIGEALRQIHEPDSAALLEQARRRFIYQELLVLPVAWSAGRNPAGRLYPRSRNAFMGWGVSLYLMGFIVAAEVATVV
jgi:RecG-like helicase